MPEIVETDPHPKQESNGDRVGDSIRKARITRRIAIESIAKDLKINVKYVKSLEANEYSNLPADPYVRVYLRSLAKYLMLDPDDILKRFYEERGGAPDTPTKESKIAITMVENSRSKTPWVIIVAVIAVLIGLSIIGKKAGWPAYSSNEGGADVSPSKKSAADSAARQHTRADSIEDSLLGALIPHAEPSTTPPQASPVQFPPATMPEVKKETAAMDSGKMVLEIRAVKDSVWIQVFSDGQSWKNVLHANQSKVVKARDSLIVHVGNNSFLRYTFNNRPLAIKAGDVAVFKLTRSSSLPEMWTLAKWASVFKGRI